MSASIIRTYHNRENPFVQLNKGALWDKNLSLKAVGLWARCMSRPDDWEFNVSELCNNCKEGRKAIDSAIQELIDQGYAIRIDYYEKAADGKFSSNGTHYAFFEFPATQEDKNKILDEFKKFYRDCRFGNLRGGNLQKDELLKTKEETKDIKEQTTTPPNPQEGGSERALLLNQFLKNLNPEQAEQAVNYYLKNKAVVETKNRPFGFVVAAIKGGWSESAAGQTRIEADKEWTAKVLQAFSNRTDILGIPEGILFQLNAGVTSLIFKYTDHGYRDQVESRLRKMNLCLKGIG